MDEDEEKTSSQPSTPSNHVRANKLGLLTSGINRQITSARSVSMKHIKNVKSKIDSRIHLGVDAPPGKHLYDERAPRKLFDDEGIELQDLSSFSGASEVSLSNEELLKAGHSGTMLKTSPVTVHQLGTSPTPGVTPRLPAIRISRPSDDSIVEPPTYEEATAQRADLEHVPSGRLRRGSDFSPGSSSGTSGQREPRDRILDKIERIGQDVRAQSSVAPRGNVAPREDTAPVIPHSELRALENAETNSRFLKVQPNSFDQDGSDHINISNTIELTDSRYSVASNTAFRFSPIENKAVNFPQADDQFQGHDSSISKHRASPLSDEMRRQLNQQITKGGTPRLTRPVWATAQGPLVEDEDTVHVAIPLFPDDVQQAISHAVKPLRSKDDLTPGTRAARAEETTRNINLLKKYEIENIHTFNPQPPVGPAQKKPYQNEMYRMFSTGTGPMFVARRPAPSAPSADVQEQQATFSYPYTTSYAPHGFYYNTGQPAATRDLIDAGTASPVYHDIQSFEDRHYREPSTPKHPSKIKGGITSVFSLFRSTPVKLKEDRRGSDTVDPATTGHTVRFTDQPATRHSFDSVDPPVPFYVQNTKERRPSLPHHRESHSFSIDELLMQVACCCCWPIGLAAKILTCTTSRKRDATCMAYMGRQMTLYALLVGIAFYMVTIVFLVSVLLTLLQDNR
ncbi:uncharacterized protein LOC131936409 [Physella acuta]|uniref:uncharacterized protein LOC131936409 n=1 Tax=Physella acuta TaxID=109671 RepID=UPI0027DBA7D7|nr:uncharacterized protein LOC131936409 [Physella acuta]